MTICAQAFPQRFTQEPIETLAGPKPIARFPVPIAIRTQGVVGDAGLFGRAARQRIQPMSAPLCSQALCRSEGGGTAATAGLDGPLSNPLSTAVTW